MLANDPAFHRQSMFCSPVDTHPGADKLPEKTTAAVKQPTSMRLSHSHGDIMIDDPVPFHCNVHEKEQFHNYIEKWLVHFSHFHMLSFCC